MGSRVRIRLFHILHFVRDLYFLFRKILSLALMIGVTASDRGPVVEGFKLLQNNVESINFAPLVMPLVFGASFSGDFGLLFVHWPWSVEFLVERLPWD